MGKVKHARFDGRAHNYKKYQFPMGKVKFLEVYMEYLFQQYQFPMGKVKPNQNK